MSNKVFVVNVVAFYSGPLFFKTIHDNDTSHRTLVAMEYSLGFGEASICLLAIELLLTETRSYQLLICTARCKKY